MSAKIDHIYKLRHTTQHVFQQALKELGYKTNQAIGPAIEEGFYADFELLEGTISEEDFEKIENKMLEIAKRGLGMKEEKVSQKDAKDLFKSNPYKLELIEELSKSGEEITLWITGNKDEFVDLCKGPHIQNTKEIKYFKLLSIAGAYWRGDEKNKMLTRIYGTAFESKKELSEYLKYLKNRKENDHRTLGQKLDLFCFSELVGKGFVMYTPKGTIVKNELKKALVDISKKYGVQEVNIPHVAKIDLYKKSGHAEKFEDELFWVKSHYKEDFVLKPVNCPHHTQIYASRQRSYRDLPIRYIESTQQHRDEKPGAIGGLNRTRSFELDDGHTFCTPEQIKEEVKNTVNIVEEFYTSLGMWGKQWVSLSFKDPNTPEKYIGNDKDWEIAQNMLRAVNKELKLGAKEVEGEAALYGPKIDFMYKDVLGNDVQLATVQVDFAMPERFGLKYIDENGKEKTPVMLHRAILGSYGRFIANLLESTGGAFPVWLSPVQVQIIPISDKHIEYAKKLSLALTNKNIRHEIDMADETMGNKIRKAQEQKIPYMIIVGAKEEEKNVVSIRDREGNQQNMIKLDEFVKRVVKNISNKSLEV